MVSCVIERTSANCTPACSMPVCGMARIETALVVITSLRPSIVSMGYEGACLWGTVIRRAHRSSDVMYCNSCQSVHSPLKAARRVGQNKRRRTVCCMRRLCDLQPAYLSSRAHRRKSLDAEPVTGAVENVHSSVIEVVLESGHRWLSARDPPCL